MTLLAGAIGYLVGGLPSAWALGRLAGVDLTAAGSRNPGANNAVRLGGPLLGAAVLVAALAKGSVAVLSGGAIAGEWGMAAGGLGASLGNVVPPWPRLRGGKGLGISGGVLAAAWPGALPAAILVIAVVAALLRASGPAALAALGALILLAAAGPGWWAPAAWGIEDQAAVLVLAVGLGLVVAPKHIVDTVRWRRGSRERR